MENCTQCPKCGNYKTLNSMCFKMTKENSYYEYYCDYCDTYFIMKKGLLFVRYGRINDDID